MHIKSSFQLFKILPLCVGIAACGGGSGGAGGQDATVNTTSEQGSVNQPNPNSNLAEVSLSVSLPNRLRNLSIPLEMLVTVGGAEYLMNVDSTGYNRLITLPKGQPYVLYIAVRRSNDQLLLASARGNIFETTADAIPLAIPAQEFSTDIDSDSDGFTNIAELERGSSPTGLSEDFDGDGIANESDKDDDNDGVLDVDDAFPLNFEESLDTDGDGIGNTLDYDDDNDLIIDIDDKFPLDPTESLDLDLDGLGNNEDTDDDGDGVIDLEDPQPHDRSINGNEDTDGDGYRDRDDAFPYDPREHNDVDGDGIGDIADLDDDGNGVPDDQDNAIVAIPFTNSPPRIDGAYGWEEWDDATSADSKGNYLTIDHLLADTRGILLDQDPNTEHRWRAMHDGTYLYVLVEVDNEPFYERHDDSVDIWLDDGIELFFDVGNEGSTSFDTNDYQVLLRYNYQNPDSVVRGANSAYGLWVSYCSNLGLETPQTLHTYYEMKISLTSIGLITGQRFGFETQINEDDDGGDRDAKWGWYAPSGADTTWQHPHHLGQAILIPER